MLRQRVLVALLLFPVGLGAILLGGWVFTAFITIFLAGAAWEAVRLYRASGFKPAGLFVLGGVIILVAARNYDQFASAPWLLTLLVLLCMVWHLIDFERGRDQAATDFGITVALILYLGWVGAYFISLRNTPDHFGAWWMMLVLPAVWFADSGAYFIGSRWGKHRLSPRLSPKKSWEGYFGGIVAGIAGGMLLGWIFGGTNGQGSTFNVWSGALIGLVMGVLPTLGDLGESMIKRQAGVKDSGNALPGHGGFFDRIDSWLWAVPVGYYLIVWLFLTNL